MTRLNRPRTKLQREGDQRARTVLHDVVAEMVALREDSGMSRRAVAASAGISASTLADIEAGRCTPGVEVLARIGSVLGARLVVRFQSGAGPMVRDHLQAAMVQALIRILDPRWRRSLEVPVYRPVRGVIDMVLDDLPARIRVATEAQSEMRRLEQQVRWARMKADALADALAEPFGSAWSAGGGAVVACGSGCGVAWCAARGWGKPMGKSGGLTSAAPALHPDDPRGRLAVR